jgi:hypothetical protein
VITKIVFIATLLLLILSISVGREVRAAEKNAHHVWTGLGNPPPGRASIKGQTHLQDLADSFRSWIAFPGNM